MDATLEQFISYLDNTVREALGNEDKIPEEADVSNAFSQLYDALAFAYPIAKQCNKNEIVSKLVERYCSELTIKKKLGFEFKDEDSHPWLSEVENSIDWFYWNRYKQYLVRDKKWAQAAVKSIDRDGRNILDLMANPLKDGSFTRRGLVVASVQSGKTANYIGLVCRAADAGYRIIIVMAGVHNVLRNQTQARLEDGFTGFNIENRKVEPVGVGNRNQARRPIACTSREADFSKSRADALKGIQTVQANELFLFVVKKNSKSLQQVYEWLKSNGNQNEPLLLIDDEADNASINGKYKLEKRENEPTKINGQIRNLLNLFNKACYVGYTATPFANVLIDPSVDSDEYGRDLFPSNFIYTLEESSDYFGAKKVFGDYDEPTHKHLRFIDDADDVLPAKHKSSFEPFMLPLSLKAAIRTFVLATTIKTLRFGTNFHSTMMVNVSPYKKPQNCMRNLVEDYLIDLNTAAKSYGALSPEDALEASPHLKDLKATWELEYAGCGFGWNEIQPRLYDPNYHVLSINTDSGDALDYENRNERVIAVGGYRLSRGLTLEGLTVSYYSRNARAYDALMQMARWFGYRPGYEDLCRIWMTDQAAGWYKFVSDSTENLFDQLRSMRQVRRTPKNYVLKIRQSPDALTVTARNKMGAGQKEEAPIVLNEEFTETFTFDRSEEIVASNKVAFFNLLSKIAEYADFSDGGTFKYFFTGVPAELIIDYLSAFENGLAYSLNCVAAGYINERLIEGELTEWDVLLAHGGQANQYIDLPSVGLVNMEQRYPGASSNKKVIVIGERQRLSGRGVEAAGLSSEEKKAAEKEYAIEHGGGNVSNCPDRYYRKKRKRPLLVLHPICVCFNKKQVEKKLVNKCKLPTWWDSWESWEPFYGWSVSFPYTDKQTEPVAYVLNSVTLKNLMPEPEDSDDDYEDD